MYLFYLLAFLIIFNTLKADDINYVKQLRSYFLKPSNYDRYTRPVQYSNKTTKIAFGMIITQILDLNLKRDILTADAIFHMVWTDDYIKWNPAKYGNVTKIRFTTEEIWRPDLEIWNTGLDIFQKDRYASDSSLVANYNGTIYWMSPITLCSHCDLDLENYPFDTQSCIINLGIKEYKLKEAAFIFKNNKSISGPYSSNSQYTVTDLHSEVKDVVFYDDLAFSTIKIKLTLNRRLSSYHYFFTIPHTLSIIFCLLMFKFELYSNIRTLFAFISILLDLKIIYIVIIEVGLKTFDTPLLVKHVGLNLIFAGLLLIISLFVRHYISFFYSLSTRLIVNLENSLFFRYSIIESSKLIENDLIKIIKNDQYNKIIQIEKSTLNKFSLLIQLIDRLLILIYCLITFIVLCIF